MNFTRINQIFLPVIELHETMNWYLEHFNITHVHDGFHEGNRTIELAFAKTSFFLVEVSHVNPYTHIPFNFHTNRLTAYHDTFTKAGITVTDLASDDNVVTCDFYDPEGNRIGLCYEDNNSNLPHTEIGGTFLTVRSLNDAVSWYQEKLGYDFEFFQATGAAGVIGPTPALMPELTIYYGVNKFKFPSDWSRVTLVETPDFNHLIYSPYTIYSSDIAADHELLRVRGVEVSELVESDGKQKFHFWDLDGNQIGIVEE